MALFSLFRKQQYHVLSPSQSDLDEGEKESGIPNQSRGRFYSALLPEEHLMGNIMIQYLSLA